MLARANPPSFFDLQSMLLVEENHVRTETKTSEGQMFFSNSDGGRRRGRDGRGRFDLSHEGNSKLWQEEGSHRGTFGRRGASTPNKVGERRYLRATTVAKSAIAKRSAEKEEVSWLRQAANSQTTLPMPNMPTTVNSS